MARRLLVGHDGSRASSIALAHAARLARARHGCLTVVLALPRVARWAAFAPVNPLALEREAQEEAEQELTRAVRAIHPCVSVTSVGTRGALGRALVETWQRGEHDAVVLADPFPFGPRRAAVRRLRRAGVEPILIGGPARAPRVDRRRALPRLPRLRRRATTRASTT